MIDLKSILRTGGFRLLKITDFKSFYMSSFFKSFPLPPPKSHIPPSSSLSAISTPINPSYSSSNCPLPSPLFYSCLNFLLNRDSLMLPSIFICQILNQSWINFLLGLPLPMTPSAIWSHPLPLLLLQRHSPIHKQQPQDRSLPFSFPSPLLTPLLSHNNHPSLPITIAITITNSPFSSLFSSVIFLTSITYVQKTNDFIFKHW